MSDDAAPASAAATDRDRQRHARRSADVLDGTEADDRADEHHPLDAEVEHAGALGEQLAERGEEERRPVGDRRGEDDTTMPSFTRPPPPRRRQPARTVDRDAVADEQLAAEHANRMSPCMTPTSPEGKSAPCSV